MKNDTAISHILHWFIKYRRFRILLTYLYPFLKNLGIIGLLQKINRGSFSDPYDIHRTLNQKVLEIYEEDIKKLGSIEQYHVDFKRLFKKDKEYIFGFLLNPDPHDIHDIENACRVLEVNPIFFSINNPLLFKEIREKKIDGLFIKPDYSNYVRRTVFQEAVDVIITETDINIYPTPRELNIYESKRTLFNFMAVNNIPHPETNIFYDLDIAENHLKEINYPVIFKTNTGAGASGVEMLRNSREAIKLARQLFTRYYLRRMETDRRASDWGYMIVQKYIDQVKEYRIMKTGDSWFGFQKWKKPGQEFFSGSGTSIVTSPSLKLFSFCKSLADKFGFTSIAIDIFEDINGELLVNELQTWSGCYYPSELYVNDLPGRYVYSDGGWLFEPGYFTVFGTYPLRIIDFISILQKKNNLSVSL